MSGSGPERRPLWLECWQGWVLQGLRHLDFIPCTVGPDLRQRTGNVLFAFEKTTLAVERRLVQLRMDRGTPEEDI